MKDVPTMALERAVEAIFMCSEDLRWFLCELCMACGNGVESVKKIKKVKWLWNPIFHVALNVWIIGLSSFIW